MSVRGIGHDASSLYSINTLQNQTAVASTDTPDGDGDGGASQVQRHHRGATDTVAAKSGRR